MNNNDKFKDSDAVLRAYLLGAPLDTPERERIEKALLDSEEFGWRLEAAEYELIENFLDGEMDPAEQAAFHRVFLASPERVRQLRLVQKLRTLSAKGSLSDPLPAPRSFRWQALNRPWGIGLAVALILITALIAWQFTRPASDIDRAIAILQKTYQSERPTEGRISILPDYAPHTRTRGERVNSTETRSREQAERLLLDERNASPGPGIYHALGLYYLTEGEYEKARAELLLAEAAAEDRPQVHNDLGVAALEMARKAKARGDSEKTFSLLDEALRHFDRAIELDRDFGPAIFNRALCLEETLNSAEARLAWLRYLELDDGSKWSVEAREHLAMLDSRSDADLSPSDLDARFLNAFRQGDDAAARDIIASNRELIRGRYVPLRLAMALTKQRPDSRQETLDALAYSGRLEHTVSGDEFTRQIARYYATASESKLTVVSSAQDLMREGWKETLEQDFVSAGESFRAAEDIFTAQGDIWEAALAAYFRGYSEINSGNTDRGLDRLLALDFAAKARSFVWLRATILHWIGGAYIKQGHHTKAVAAYREALRLAESLGDNYSIQRNSLELSNRMAFIGQRRSSHSYLDRALRESARAGSSGRQRYRTLIDASTNFFRTGLGHLAKTASYEAVLLADDLSDRVWQVQARAFAATAAARLGDQSEARDLLNEARKIAEGLGKEDVRIRSIAVLSLKQGEVEIASGNNELAEAYFKQAVEYYDSARMPLNREDANRGRLMSLLALNRDQEVESQLARSLQFAAEHEAGIEDEKERSSFWLSRSNIYDIATAFEFGRGNRDAAYRYSELSNAQSVRDQQFGSGTMKAGGPRDPSGPISLAELTSRLPAEVQIVQYSLLDDRLLIWHVSRDGFRVTEQPIPAAELRENVARFRRTILEKKAIEDPLLRETGRWLYASLLAPIESELKRDRLLCLIPNGALFDLPFAALPLPDGSALVEKYALFVAPSGTGFVKATEAARHRSTIHESLIAVGNPAFDSELFSDLSVLPEAETEAKDIASNYPRSEVLLGQAASKAAILRALADRSVVHLSGHYLAPSYDGLAPAFLVAPNETDPDGMITPEDIRRIRAPNLRLVVLSSCRSGLESPSGRSEISGLASALLSAGTPLVVGSLWDVDSRASSELMTRFHRLRTAGGRSSIDALRQAQLDLLEASDDRFSAPYFWSGFTAYGGHATF